MREEQPEPMWVLLCGVVFMCVMCWGLPAVLRVIAVRLTDEVVVTHETLGRGVVREREAPRGSTGPYLGAGAAAPYRGEEGSARELPAQVWVPAQQHPTGDEGADAAAPWRGGVR